MAQNQSTPLAKLIRLSDTTLELASQAEDIRGRHVLDNKDDEIGEVHDLLIDDREKRVRFLLVEAGGFLGIGAQKIMIPVDAITRIDDKNVYVNLTRDHVASAPPYDPDLIDERYLAQVYGYYGMGPFWAAGYLYPSFPFYY